MKKLSAVKIEVAKKVYEAASKYRSLHINMGLLGGFYTFHYVGAFSPQAESYCALAEVNDALTMH